MKNECDKKTARFILFVTSGIKQDPTCFWEGETKRFRRTLRKISDDPKTMVGVIEERKGNDKWETVLVLVTEQELHKMSGAVKKYCGGAEPEEVVVVGRKCFLTRFSPSDDRTGSRYHWTGRDHPFGWTVYIDRNGEKLENETLTLLIGELATVFVTNFESEMANGRLAAARRRI